ncbi:uncharacterized protein LOC134820283 isoform X2 [Bolinopsis microptera]|uniref:uncharacterized protein LOC134820283 isoform X2 n=1 Tax=Bolinopsis microptera TaxID=2820187 RepID=UPI00307AB52B
MASVKQKLASALDFDKTVVIKQNGNINGVHQASKAINIKRVIPTFSVNGVYSCQLSSVSDQLAMGYGNGDVEVYNVETGEQISLIQNVCKNLPVTSIRYLYGSGAFFATGPSGKVRQIDPSQNINQWVLELDNNEINCVDVNLDNTYLALVGKLPYVFVYDVETFKVLTVFEGPKGISLEGSQTGHSQRLFVTKFDPVDKFTVMSAGWDSSVKLWDTRTNSVIWNVSGPKVCGEGIDKSGNYLVTASWFVKDALQLWDTRSQKLVSTLNCRTVEDSEFLYCGQFYTHDKVICGGSGVTNAKLVDTVENKVVDEVMTNLKVMQSLCLSRERKMCVTAGLGDHATCATFS